MTINGVSPNAGSQFIETPGDDFVGNVSERIAVLVLETEQTSKDAYEQRLDEARQEFSSALSNEVEALRDQADAAFRGALFSGAMTIAGGSLGIWGAARDCSRPWQDSASKAAIELSGPLGSAVGNNYGAANAASANGAQQLAQSEMAELRGDIDRAEQSQSRALDWSSKLVAGEAATTSAILSNMA